MPLPATPANRHRVQRQIVDMAIGDSAEGTAVHQELARPFWDRAAAELEPVFDAVAGPHDLVRVDRLELNLGRIEGPDWPNELRRRLVAELTRRLALCAADADAQHGHEPVDRRRVEPWREFVFFLSHGYLPWWGSRPPGEWVGTVVDGLDAAGWRALLDAVRTNPDARVRLVHAASDDVLDVAIGVWSGVPHAARVLDHWSPAPPGTAARQRWRRVFWIAVLEWICAADRRGPGGPALVRELLALRHAGTEADGRSGTWPASLSDQSDPDDPAASDRHATLRSPWREWLSQVDVATVEPAAAHERRPGVSFEEPPTPTGSRAVSVPDADGPPTGEEAIYIDGAGAVLLHPFLERLFRGRGLLSDRYFRDRNARDRAVHLIGRLTFGGTEIPEYELVLAKVLCGMPLEEPLEPVLLDDDDVADCDAVLGAVLEHWTALRSRSTEWLRHQFLLREGKLEAVDSGRLLTVERRAQDVLLARLPWGYGVIGLPWVTDRLFVRWLD